ncbi:MAG: hypothetical protein VW518_00815, partial [Burkholderiaceae bacterium]
MGSLTLTGDTPVLSSTITITPNGGSLALTGSAPTVQEAWVVTPSTGSATLTGFLLTVERTQASTPSAGSLSLTGFAPTVIEAVSVTPSVGSLTLTGSTPTVTLAVTRTPSVGSLTLTGDTPTLTQDNGRTPSVSSLTLTGSAPVLTTAFVRQPSVGSLTLTGSQPTVERLGGNTDITPAAGSLTAFGQTVNYGLTRFYFPLTTAADVSPPTPTNWNETSLSVERYLARSPAGGSTLTDVFVEYDTSDHTVNQDALYRQYVSDPLEAQRINGQLDAQIQCSEAHAANNLVLSVKVLVVSNDGATVRATLLALTRAATELDTTLTNRTIGPLTLTPYTCVWGDRLVIELGVGGTPGGGGGTQGHNATLRWGEDASSGDLPEDESTTGTTYRPWAEFSTQIRFATVITPSVGSLTLTGQTPVLARSYTITPSVGSLTLTGSAPTVTLDTGRVPTEGSLTLTGDTPVLSAGTARTPTTGSLTLTGNQPTLTRVFVITPSVGSASLTGAVPVLDGGLTVSTGSLTLTGAAPTVSLGTGRSPSTGS